MSADRQDKRTFGVGITALEANGAGAVRAVHVELGELGNQRIDRRRASGGLLALDTDEGSGRGLNTSRGLDFGHHLCASLSPGTSSLCLLGLSSGIVGVTKSRRVALTITLNIGDFLLDFDLFRLVEVEWKRCEELVDLFGRSDADSGSPILVFRLGLPLADSVQSKRAVNALPLGYQCTALDGN